jgi:hypothetical protein
VLVLSQLVRFVRRDIHSLRTERRGARCLRSVGERVVAPFAEGDPLEAGVADNLCQRCLRQRAGNSPGPEIEVVSGLVSHVPLDDDVGDLHSATRLEHPQDLGEHRLLVRRQIDHAVGDHNVR